MANRRKISTTVYIEAEQDEELRALSAVTKVPAVEYVRQGIDLVLARERRRRELLAKVEEELHQ